MSRILYINGKNLIPSDEIAKAVFKSEKAVDRGMFVDFASSVNVTRKTISEYDVFILSRPDDILSYGIARTAKNSGAFVLSFLDDDLMSAKGLIHEAKFRQSALKKILGISNVLYATNPLIAEKYGTYMRNKRIYVGNTAVEENEFVDIEKKFSNNKDIIKMVYAAGSDHDVLFEKYIKPVIPRLADRYGDTISLTFMGIMPDVSDIKDRIKIFHVPRMPLQQYRKKIQEGEYDIGLSPLEIDNFSKSKYFNKYLEYSTAGIIGIYTETEPYALVVEDEYNGLLVKENDLDEWYEKICYAIDSKDLRKKCVENAYTHILGNFSQDSIFDKMVKEIPELKNYTNQRSKVASLFIFKAKGCFDIVRGRFFLIAINYRDGGIKKVLKKAKEHFQTSTGKMIYL